MGPAHGYRHLSARLSATYLSSGDVASTSVASPADCSSQTSIGCEIPWRLLESICSFCQQPNTEHLHQAMQEESLTTCNMLLTSLSSTYGAESNSGPS